MNDVIERFEKLCSDIFTSIPSVEANAERL